MRLGSFQIVVALLTAIAIQLPGIPLATAAPLPQDLPQAKTPSAAIELDLHHDGVSVKLRRIDFWDGYVVFVGTATTTSFSDCLLRSDFVLQLGDIRYQAAERTTTRAAYGINSPGSGFFSLCLSRGESRTLLLPFFAPVNGNKAQLIYEDQAVPLSHSLTELSLAIATPVPTATPTSTSTPTPTATPTTTFTPASVATIAGTPSSFSLPLPSQASSIFRMGEVSNQGIKFSLERIDFWTTLPDGARPTKDIFVVFTGLLSALDTGSSTHCVGGSDVELHIGASVYQMDNMRSVNRFYQSDFPGYILPQCVSSEPQTTFFIFDAKVTTDPIYLFFHAAQLDIDSSLSQLAPVAAITPNSAAIRAQLPTVTPDLASPVGLLTITVTTNRNANLRAGPSTEHEVVATVPAGQNLAVVASNEDASWYLLDTGAWIAAFLVDPTNDLSELSQLPVYGASNQSSATPSSSGLDVFSDPNRVCDALADEGWVPLADRLAKWSSIDGEGYLYSCVTDSIQVTPGGFSQVGDVPNTIDYYAESHLEDRVEKIILRANIFKEENGQPVIEKFLALATKLFSNLGLNTPNGLAEAITSATPATFAMEYGKITLVREKYNLGYGLLLTIETDAPALTVTTGTTVLQATINGRANIRSGPGTTYSIVGEMNAGETIVIAGSNDAGDWLQLDDGRWVATFLVDSLPASIPTLPPTATPTQTPTPNATRTAAAERGAQATATIQAYVNVPPKGTWCGQNGSIGVCVGDFRYTNRIDYTAAPNNGRFVAFGLGVVNGRSVTIAANPNNVTVVMQNGRTFAYHYTTYSYWSTPLEHIEIAPGNNVQGGLVFLVPNDVAIRKVIYRGGLFEPSIEIDLFQPPKSE